MDPNGFSLVVVERPNGLVVRFGAVHNLSVSEQTKLSFITSINEGRPRLLPRMLRGERLIEETRDNCARTGTI